MSLRKPLFTNILETDFSVKGRLAFNAEKRSAPLESLRLRLEESDYRQSEAFCLGQNRDRLQLVKALFLRGSIPDAEIILKELQLEFNDNSELRLELQLQECRLHAYYGDWKKTIAICSQLEREEDLPILSRMTLLQIRANAYFEETLFDQSTRDLKKLESLRILFPHSPINFYALANEIKILCRSESNLSSLAAINKCWDLWKANLPSKNLDPLFTLLRLETDRLRALKVEHTHVAFAAFQVANALGDDLYAGICFLELFHSVANPPTSWIDTLNLYKKNQTRVRDLESQIHSGEATCETARSIREAKANRLGGEFPLVRHNQGMKKIILLRSQIHVDLESREARSISLQPRTLEILEILAMGKIEKEELFLNVWKLKSFDKERHDPIIRTALKRIRAQTGLEIISSFSQLSLNDSTIVLDL